MVSCRSSIESRLDEITKKHVRKYQEGMTMGFPEIDRRLKPEKEHFVVLR